jgi:hypothetical protein
MPADIRSSYERGVLENYLSDIRRDTTGFLMVRANQLVRMWTYGSSGLPVAKGDLVDLLKRGDYSQFILRLALFLIFGPLFIALAVLGAVIGIRRNRESAILVVYPVFITVICLPIYADFRYSLAGQVLLFSFVSAAIISIIRGIRHTTDPRGWPIPQLSSNILPT